MDIWLSQHCRLENIPDATECAGFDNIIQNGRPVAFAFIGKDANDVARVQFHTFGPFVLFHFGSDRSGFADA